MITENDKKYHHNNTMIMGWDYPFFGVGLILLWAKSAKMFHKKKEEKKKKKKKKKRILIRGPDFDQFQ